MKHSTLTFLIGSMLVANAQAATVSFQSFRLNGHLENSRLATSYLITGDPEFMGIYDSVTCGVNSEVVVFNEENGYGCFTTVHLDVFALQALNVVFESPWEMALQSSEDSGVTVERHAAAKAIPEMGSPLIGGLGLMLLLRRRRY